MVAEGKLEPAQDSMPAIVQEYLKIGVTGRGELGDDARLSWGLGKFVGTKHWCTLKMNSPEPSQPYQTLRFKFANGVNDKSGFNVENTGTGKVYLGVRADQLAAFVDALANPCPGVEIVSG